MAGVDVTVGTDGFPLHGTTGPDGRVIVKDVPLGTRNSSVNRLVSADTSVENQFISAETFASLFDCGSVGVVDLELTPPIVRHATMKGTVTDDSGTPLAGITVTVQGGRGTTDANGHYDLEHFLYGVNVGSPFPTDATFDPTGSGNDVWFAQKPVTLVDNQTTTLDVVMLRRRFGTVTGTVTDAVTGTPIAGAAISGLGLNIATGPDGTFHTTQAPLGTDNTPQSDQVAANADGYWFGTAHVDVSADTPATVSLQLLRVCAPVVVTGRTVNAATGAALPGVVIQAGGQAATTSDDSGHFVLPGLQPFQNQPFGTTLVASKVGFFTATHPITVFCGAHIVVDFGDEATGTGSVHGKVTRQSDGTALAGLTVGGDWGAITTTAADGTYSFTNVPIGGEPTGGWGVHVQAPPLSGLGDATKTVTITAGGDPALDFALTAPTNHAPVAQSQTIDVAAGHDRCSGHPRRDRCRRQCAHVSACSARSAEPYRRDRSRMPTSRSTARRLNHTSSSSRPTGRSTRPRPK